MANLRQEMTKNLGKWTMIHTKSGAFYGKIENVGNNAVTVLLPDLYTVTHPSAQLVEKNVDVKAEDVQGEEFFRRPFRRFRRFRRFHRFLFPFFFFI
ncbi:hypothetical protein PP175_10600 [Aneurinibacillus sp. Ricciae_BoGa-3]|uniref:hypothetical protein n=1 Tax=Aneurinibacillus sp. Ricciae_BoGa-3 TaxID=3022697 RepID=UPI002341520F|nr:hypothetical protein [Aneurinibacillus sp. Ricciae_BoGa-3]WCK56318.1 hypothetical protein PP175_10600 [Aneurinibacillus sp. Ricciae_BoGa-3]